jgi:signal transduction histidine kinase
MKKDNKNQDRDDNYSGPTISFTKEELLAELDNLNRRLAARDIEIIQLKEKRGEEIKELQAIKAQLEEAKGILEIKVEAKTRELRNLTESLEKQIKDRTKELQEKVEESENSRVALMNMLEDMEELRRRTEEEKEKTLAIFTTFSDGLLFFDSMNKLVMINPQAEAYFEIEANESKQFIGEKIINLKENQKFEYLAELLGSKMRKIFRKEIPMKKNLSLEVSTVEVGNEQNRVGTLVILHDITREKTIERMKTEFVSIAAHQLRTPMSAIKWTLRMILDGDLGPITGEQKDFLEKTYISNERMISLINDLLNVTRIEEGRHLYNLILVNLEDLTSNIVSSYTEIAKRKSLVLEYAKPEQKLPQVKVDVEKIRLVISNLIENAIKYTPVKGKITIIVSVEDGRVQVAVKDNGVGIVKEQQERIFTKFFRGTNVMRMETEGTGLGLFIAKNIVETHGGKIWFESEEGKGTTFIFNLPAIAT